MSNMKTDNFDALYAAGNKCENFDIEKISGNLNNSALAIVYITVSGLVLSLVYFFCRPRNGTDAEAILEKDPVNQHRYHYWLNPRKNMPFASLKRGEDIKVLRNKYRHYLRSGKFADVLRARENWEDPLKLSSSELAQFRFRAWWPRGRIVFFLGLVGTIAAAVLCIVLLNLYYEYFLLPTSDSGGFDYCSAVRARSTGYSSFAGYFGGAFLFCCYLLA
jgi:hypothetical protein